MRYIIVVLSVALLSAPAFAQDYSWKHELELRAQAQQQAAQAAQNQQQAAQMEADSQQALFLQQQELNLLRNQQMQQQTQQVWRTAPPNITGVYQSAMSGFDQGAARAQEERLRQLEIQRLQQEIQQNGGQ